MLKSILNLEGAQGLTKNEQKEINGGVEVYIHITNEIACITVGGYWSVGVCFEENPTGGGGGTGPIGPGDGGRPPIMK
ncbi:hypothetical protein [Dokdonia sp. Asnod3-C12]|uniref:hypothetical protein n=1 Tax=Dokdonia sp. Asnod3-C12 TaxID=3160575 RepID=UPI00386F14CB